MTSAEHSSSASESPPDMSWRVRLLNTLLLTVVLLGTLFFIFNSAVNTGFATSTRGVINMAMLLLLYVAALYRRAPEILRLHVLLASMYLMGVVNLINQGPFSSGVLFPFTMVLLLAILYWNTRGGVITVAAMLVVYAAGAYGWSNGYFPINYVLQQRGADDPSTWLRAALGQLMIGVMLVAIVRSITEHSKRSLMALRVSEERARLLIEHAPEAIVLLDMQSGKFAAGNHAAEILFGYSLKELFDKSPLDVSPPAQPDGRLSTEAASMQLDKAMNGLTTTFEWTHRHADGHDIDCEVRLLRLPDPSRILIRGSILDLSERKRTERALRALSTYDASITGEAFFKASTEQMARELSVCCAMVAALREREGRIYLELLSLWPHDPSLSMPVSMEYSIEHSIAAEILAGKTLHVGHGATHAYPRDALLKQFATESYIGVPIIGPDAKVLGLVAVLDDKIMPDSAAAKLLLASTATRAAAELVRMQNAADILRLNAELERRVEERTKQLTFANSELEAFSYSVSHDLRGPLRNIDGYCNAVEQDFGSKLEPQVLDYLHRVRDVTQRMRQLIDDMLSLAQAARGPVHTEPLDLVALAQDIFRELSERESHRKISFVHPAKIAAQADAKLTRIVLTNLLDNAWKYTSGRPDAKIELGMITAKDKQPADVYYIKDNGVGFDMSDVNKLFVPFQRLHKQSEFEGTGIGLATVQRIIARHGGHVWLESTPDVGTTVFFTVNDHAH
jgi:PAS domain S-box-containing protein